jgi:glycerol-3-phosphate dehydrogenase
MVQRNLDALIREQFDLLILGGGITGAGVAVDAASRGWRVALIDKGDFASGTSSVSSKLIHGGLRYLEHGHIYLVYEALHERRWLLRAAPHLVTPLRFVLPFYQGARVPPWQWRLGLMLYDLLAGGANIHRSRPLLQADLRREISGLRCGSRLGGAVYYDAQMDDARLCLEVLHTAVAHGAVIANYVEAIAFEKSGTTIQGVVARDHVAGKEFSIRARQVLNATGPWVDAVGKLAGGTAEPRLAPTKGVHIILPDRQLAAALLLLHPRDGRVFFVIPWLGKTLVGTTDTVSPETPDALTVQVEEIEYLLEAWHYYFPDAGDAPVLGSFAGLRPLIRAKPSEPSARPREFRIFTSPGGLITVAGGKYTTFRAMAERITDAIAPRLGKRVRCRTKRLTLASAPRQPWPDFRRESLVRSTHQFSLSATTALRLIERYGTRLHEVEPYLKEPAGCVPLVAGEPELRGELAYQRDHEMAIFPADHFLRRMRLGLYCPDLSEPRPSGSGEQALYGGGSALLRK